MSFGKKGLAQGQAAAQSAGFGKAQAGGFPTPAQRRPQAAAVDHSGGMSDEEIAAKREAFLASERAAGNISAATAAAPITTIGARSSEREEYAGPLPSHSSERSTRPRRKLLFGDPAQRNLILAYVFWYFCSPISLHRFYCGASDSAWYQIGAAVIGFVLLAIYPPMGIAVLLGWFGWIFLDLFLMPGMMRRFKAEYSFSDTEIFA